MAFRLVVSDTVLVPVSGKIPDAAGRYAPFNFTLTCKRMPAGELAAAVEANETSVPAFVAGLTRGWSGVLDDDGAELPFSQDGLTALLDIFGMAGLCFRAYFEACGAKGKEKN
jgi:hypothetical protein